MTLVGQSVVTTSTGAWNDPARWKTAHRGLAVQSCASRSRPRVALRSENVPAAAQWVETHQKCTQKKNSCAWKDPARWKTAHRGLAVQSSASRSRPRVALRSENVPAAAQWAETHQIVHDL